MSARAAKLLRRVLSHYDARTNADWLRIKRTWYRMTARERASWRRAPLARRNLRGPFSPIARRGT